MGLNKSLYILYNSNQNAKEKTRDKCRYLGFQTYFRRSSCLFSLRQDNCKLWSNINRQRKTGCTISLLNVKSYETSPGKNFCNSSNYNRQKAKASYICRSCKMVCRKIFKR